ncbi:pyruvate dehydrogenase (acetyl-transferring), homodimeric type [Buchnera aphidicola]|uniref:Pyruvate dehydrogenase E1 component n=1 Tax=Buchnera aphidicola (Stegophylla sp.) TaxID=2315800 RepID=A0A4D6YMS5_9GAMM|nr:pyruvate dehydrogenase (acetyl-transferring), homodimeric type [Buchnera aphidicola (Stegophylla sp.)]QCI26325.1 pyruvate dehydrogenase (acetyl-transferring), homodimeric type [Buchnera aphidicola (Stegophylla sp.)]
MKNRFFHDIDPLETSEWIDAFQSLIDRDGIDRAKFIFQCIMKNVKKYGIFMERETLIMQDYINTISVERESCYPGNILIERNICSAVRWNAIIMVLRASNKNIDLGGHLSSFQSSATIYEVCFNHIFKASQSHKNGDLVYFQGHISPGIYSRAFLEGRLSKEQIDNFRQEVHHRGLSSYPHPKLMPNFWQFPTVSMGLSAINAIYQAKFLKYLDNRGLRSTCSRTVYVFLGDGEMDEPESKGAITMASREKLNNLIYVINCNLQRLDGPVFGNGKIICELENLFYGAGWEVIKVIWGSQWDNLLKRDQNGKLLQLMNETVDGDYQNFTSKSGAYIRKYFFGKYPETLELVKNMTDEEILNLDRGGHDSKKIFSAFQQAKLSKEKPVVILMHTVKGYGMGNIAEGKNIAHQIKYMDVKSLQYMCDRFNIPFSVEEIKKLPYITFKKGSPEYNYIHNQRRKLGGYLPCRLSKFTEQLILPSLDDFKSVIIKQNKKLSTTMVFVRILNILLNFDSIKDRIVPIIADEARTFGMEGLIRKVGIYNSNGQKYIPQDKDHLLYYREDKNGQILQEGISELGAASSWLAAATSYSNSNFPMIPFYIYYSMFGFQRVGDLFWAAGDQQARGFLIGATSGRTTLNGEGLQHQDGHSHIQSLTIPNCISYDPAYSYELAVIIQNGLHRMYGQNQENIYYYITTINENYYMPDMPIGVEQGIIRGIYKLISYDGLKGRVQLMGSGAILKSVCEAAIILLNDYSIGSDIYSVTSFTELARNGQDCERWNMLHPTRKLKVPYIAKVMNSFPAVAATDYMKLFAEQIRNYIPAVTYRVLGTDGFGRSDSRKNLRNFFEVNSFYIVISALTELYKCNIINKQIVLDAISKFNIDIDKHNPRLL